MSHNLSLLPPTEKNKIELEKQASFVVWQMKEAKAGPEAVREQLLKISDEDEQAWFQQCVEKHKRLMGVM